MFIRARGETSKDKRFAYLYHPIQTISLTLKRLFLYDWKRYTSFESQTVDKKAMGNHSSTCPQNT